jgi:flagellar motor switch protein FliN
MAQDPLSGDALPPEPVRPGSLPPDALPVESHAALWLAEEWGRQITRAVASMTGESASIAFGAHQLTPAEIDPSQQELLWWEQPLNLGPNANIWVAAGGRSWEEIGKRVLRSAGVDGATPEDIRGTYLEIVNQSLSGVASAVSKRISSEISCVPGRSAPPPAPPDGGAYAFQITLGEQVFPLLAVFAPSVASLTAAPVQPAAEGAPEERTQTAGPARKAGAFGSMDLLLDVELPVSVSFGRAQLMLKDVIKLTTGSIVELNRALSEPVEVIVNNCVIARGEVVVVEGNYGIRIKQVISRQERLRTLY